MASSKYSVHPLGLIVTIDECIARLTSFLDCHHTIYILGSEVDLGWESR